MHVFRIVTLLLIVACGCNSSTTVPAPQPPTTAQGCIDSWGDMGAQLPDQGQVAIFRSNLAGARPLLAAALSDANAAVRQRAAYMIGEIGKPARPFGPDLLAQLRRETGRLVRLYLLDALAATGYDDASVIGELRGRFTSLSDANVPPAAGGDYADVDEKLTVAAALYALDTGPNREDYLAFVLKWLEPLPAGLAADQIAGYWDRRLVAVMSLERMPTAVEAIPVLEQMLQEKDAKPWVSVRVPSVLGVLRSEGPGGEGED